MTFPRKAIFLHTQKTGGTSIVSAARQAYGHANVISHGDWLTQPYEQYCSKPFISGHFGFQFAKRLLPDRYGFTFLRDPIDRVLSLYRFCSAQPHDTYPIYAMARRMSLDDFLKFGGSIPSDENEPEANDRIVCYATIWNNMSWQLAHGWDLDVYRDSRTIVHFSPEQIAREAKKNLDAFDFVGFVETMDRDVSIILRDLGLTDMAVGRENVSTKGPRRDELTSRTLALLSAVTEIDQEVFSYARRRYDWSRRRFWPARLRTVFKKRRLAVS